MTERRGVVETALTSPGFRAFWASVLSAVSEEVTRLHARALQHATRAESLLAVSTLNYEVEAAFIHNLLQTMPKNAIAAEQASTSEWAARVDLPAAYESTV